MARSKEAATMPADVRFASGYELVDTPIWVDSAEARDFCFLSEASDRAVAPHRRVLMTLRTSRLFGESIVSRTPPLLCPFRQSFALGDAFLELLPAGSRPGSAQLLVREPRGDVLFLGPLFIEGARLAERSTPSGADTIVVDAVLPADARAPSPQAALETLTQSVRRALNDGRTPVLLADSAIGAAQEALAALGDAGLTSRAHPVVYEKCLLYRGLGIDLPLVKRFQGAPAFGEVVCLPLAALNARALRPLRRPRFFRLVEHVAASEPAGPIAGADVPNDASPLCVPMRSDLPAIIAHLRSLEPERVFVGRQHADAWANAIRAAGIEAIALRPPQQLGLL
jgi:hypothetical protein